MRFAQPLGSGALLATALVAATFLAAVSVAATLLGAGALIGLVSSWGLEQHHVTPLLWVSRRYPKTRREKLAACR
jgi:hypothetical protein